MADPKEHILVVEGDPDISDLIVRQALQPLGYQVTLAVDVPAALQNVLQSLPDLLIVNLNLPGLNAKDLLVALSSQGIEAPLVVVAEKGQEDDIIQAFRVGAVDYLHWPARDTEVASVVERALRQTREARARARLDKQLKDINEVLQRKVKELTAIVALGKAVVSITDQRLLFTRIVEGAVQTSEADLGWLTLREEASNTFLLSAHKNLPAGWANKLNQPFDDGLGSLVALSGETLLIHGNGLKKSKASTLGKAAAVVPIKVKKEVIGLLMVLRTAERPFNPTDQTLLEAVADYASISLVNARLFRALEHAAEAAKSGEKKQNTRLESVRLAVHEELQAALDPIELLISQQLDSLTEEQSQALKEAQSAIQRLERAAGITAHV